MGKYFFHLHSPEGVERDEVGLRLPDVERAYLEACSAIPAMGEEILRRRRDPMRYSFVIANVTGEVLMTVPFNELVRPRTGKDARWPRNLRSPIERAEAMALVCTDPQARKSWEQIVDACEELVRHIEKLE